MRNVLPLLLLIAASACSTVRQLPSVTDSTKVEVRIVEKNVKDTAWVELPVIKEKVATLDTASVLENKYAKSEASVSGGVLAHSLATKPVREPVAVEYKEIVRDSIIFRDRVQKQTIEVEKKLTWWQRTKMNLGLVTLAEILLAITYAIFLIFKHFLNLKTL